METNNIIIPEIMENLETTEVIETAMRKFKLPEIDKTSIVLGFAIGIASNEIAHRVVIPQAAKLAAKVEELKLKRQIKKIEAEETPVEEPTE